MGETKWLKIEKDIRDVLDEFYGLAYSKGGTWNAACDALDRISSIIGDETGRGYPREDAERKHAKGR